MYKVQNYSRIDITQNFKDETYSGYKKTKVVSALKEHIKKGEIDRACFWLAELDVSGFSEKLWETLCIFGCQEINIANPRLATFLWNRTIRFSKICNRYTNTHELCNDQESRNVLCELISVLSLSPKRKLSKNVKINENHYRSDFLKKNTIASDFRFIGNFRVENIELKIAGNEFYHYLTQNYKGTDSNEKCLFWLDWLFFYETKYKKSTKEKFKWKYKKIINSSIEYDFIWLFWDIIINCLEHKKNHKDYNILKKNIFCLYKLFTFKYKTSVRKKRTIYLKLAILLFLKCNDYSNYDVPFYNNDIIRIKACLNINELYRNIVHNNTYYREQKQKQEQTKEIVRKLNIKKLTTMDRIRNHKKMIIKQKKDNEFTSYLQKNNFTNKQTINVVKQKSTKINKQQNIKNKLSKQDKYKKYLHNLEKTKQPTIVYNKYKNIDIRLKQNKIRKSRVNMKNKYKILKRL